MRDEDYGYGMFQRAHEDDDCPICEAAGVTCRLCREERASDEKKEVTR